MLASSRANAPLSAANACRLWAVLKATSAVTSSFRDASSSRGTRKLGAAPLRRRGVADGASLGSSGAAFANNDTCARCVSITGDNLAMSLR